MATKKSPTIRIKERASWTRGARELLDVVNDVLDEMRGYWPLTLRQLHYALVEHDTFEYENSKSSYQNLSRRITQARLEGKVPWEALEDRIREIEANGGYPDKGSFVSTEIAHFLKHYGRDKQQSQDTVVEVWVEKDALSRIFIDACSPYNVPVVVARGYSSVSFLNDARERIDERYEKDEKPTHILYFGDMDPSGWHMLPRMMHTIQEEMEVGSRVKATRIALTLDIIRERKLPTNPDAIKDDAWAIAHGKKKGDPRVEEYVRNFGRVAVELDAIRPPQLAAMVKGAIEDHIDMKRFREEERAEEQDVEDIEGLREKLEAQIRKARKTWGG